MKGIGYCRVSTREQAVEGYSLETQTREIKKYCEENDIDLINIYVETGESAYTKDIIQRTEGKRVLEHIYNKDIDCVVLISDDRMFRNLENSLSFDMFAEKNNVKIIYTRQRYFDNLNKSTRFLMKTLSATINQYYSEIFAEKVKEGQINKFEKGEWNGKSPYGYDLVKSHLQINEEEASIVKLIFSMYLDKKGGELICNYLNENHYKPPKGKYWSKNSVLGMLRNEAYIGTTIYNRRAPKGCGVKFRPESEWLIKKNTHPAIISEEDFEKVQNLMKKRKKQNGNNNIDRKLTSLAPLAGLVFCEHCHSLYIPTTGSTKKRGKIQYYGCGSRRRNGKSVCSTHLIPAELLEKFVLYRMREILTSNMYKQQFELQLTKELEILQSKKKDITKLKREIAKVSTQKERLLDLMLTEENEQLVKTYKDKLTSIVTDLHILNEQLKLYESIDISAEEKEIRKQFNKSHEDITYKDFQELSREQLKTFFNYIIDHITIRELEIPDDKKVILAITIYLKLDGYAPKYTLDYLKELPTEDRKPTKKGKSKKDLPNGGGEGQI